MGRWCPQRCPSTTKGHCLGCSGTALLSTEKTFRQSFLLLPHLKPARPSTSQSSRPQLHMVTWAFSSKMFKPSILLFAIYNLYIRYGTFLCVTDDPLPQHHLRNNPFPSTSFFLFKALPLPKSSLSLTHTQNRFSTLCSCSITPHIPVVIL